MSDICEEIMDFGEGTSSGMTANQLMKQSFNRFDETLVENILSYLTFNEKVLFESISKQWKKCIYNKQTALHLTRSDTEDNNSLNKILEPITVIDLPSGFAHANGLKKVNRVWLKSILKKCHSIEKLELDCYLDLEDMDIIGRYSPKLKKIVFETMGLSGDDLDQFGQRYGHYFKSVDMSYIYFLTQYWNRFLFHCKNLTEFPSQRFSELLCEDSHYLPNLETVNNFNITKENLIKFEILCNKYNETLKKFSLMVHIKLNQKELNSLFCNLLKLKNLEDIYLYFWTFRRANPCIEKDLMKISKNMPKLKAFKLCVSTSKLKMERMFFGFKGFHNLVNLDIDINTTNRNKNINGGMECFKSCVNLKIFKLNSAHIKESFFQDIDTYLPNLTHLTIGCETDITDFTIYQISNLKHLTEFYLNKFTNCNKLIRDKSVCALIRGCPLLKTVYFGSRPKITDKTIETLIDCLNNNRKQILNFECGLSHTNGEHYFPTIDLVSFLHKIPDNLTINIAMDLIEE